MPVGDDMSMRQGLVSSMDRDGGNTEQSEDVLSPDDVAWIDSCLIKDSEIAGSNRNSSKGALFEASVTLPDLLDIMVEGDGSPLEIATQVLPSNTKRDSSENSERSNYNVNPRSELAEGNDDDHLINELADAPLSRINLENVLLPTHEAQKMRENSDFKLNLGFLEALISETDLLNLMAGEHGSPWDAPVETLPSNIKTESSRNPERGSYDLEPPSERAERNGNNLVINETADNFSSSISMENFFRPTYNEAQRPIENSDFEVNLGFPALVVEDSTEDIFRVWDLDIPEEEDELIKQLNKALAVSALEPEPSNFDVSGVGKGLQNESLDELILGIGDLNLNVVSD